MSVFDNIVEENAEASLKVANKATPGKGYAAALRIGSGFMKHSKGIGVAALGSGLGAAVLPMLEEDNSDKATAEFFKHAAVGAGVYGLGLAALKGKNFATGYWSGVKKNKVKAANEAQAAFDEVTQQL